MKFIEVQYIKEKDEYRNEKKEKIGINVENIIAVEKNNEKIYTDYKTYEYETKYKILLHVKEIGKLEIEESYENFMKRLKGKKLNKFDIITEE